MVPQPIFIELVGHEEVREEIRNALIRMFQERGTPEHDYLVSITGEPERFMLSEDDYRALQQKFGRRGYRRVSAEGKPLWGESESDPRPKLTPAKALKRGHVSRGLAQQSELPIPRKAS